MRTQQKDHPKGWSLHIGGPDRIRTDDPYNANVMRSQLRYRPKMRHLSAKKLYAA